MTGRRHGEAGQALVEFSLAIIVFMVLLMAVVDFGRAVFTYNGVAEAAREIARATSVHPGGALGASSETRAVIATQKGLVPALADPAFACVDIDGSTVTTSCRAGDWVKVTVSAPYRPLTPILGLTGSWTLQSTSSMQIP